MPRTKIESNIDQDIEYSEDQWQILDGLRQKAKRITGLFASLGFETLTFGSVAHGRCETNE